MGNWSMVYVFLADNEWGNQKMDEVAKEVFATYPDVKNLVVYVVEHGGWYLAYNREGLIVGTANDKAQLKWEAISFLRGLTGPPTYLPEIRRKAA